MTLQSTACNTCIPKIRSVADETEVEPYHLVASSRLGDSSVLLLDSTGCPTGQVTTIQLTGPVQVLFINFSIL